MRKQQNIEEEFTRVKTCLESLLQRIELQFDHLIGYSTGGDSISYFEPAFHSDQPILSLNLYNMSKYPSFDIGGEWIDLDEPIDPSVQKFWTRHQFAVGDLHPSKMILNILSFDMRLKAHLRVNIFFRMRNRNAIQQIRAIKIGEVIKIAFMIESNEFKLVKVPTDFPGYVADDPEAVFK